MSESDWPLASTSPTQCDYGEWSATQVLIPAIYILACVIGTFGNAFVLFAYLNGHGRWPWKIRSNNKSESSSSSCSVTESLIVSLALADLAFVTTLPLWAVYTTLDYH